MVNLRAKLSNFDNIKGDIAGAQVIALAASMRWLKSEAEKTAPRASGTYAKSFKYRTYKRITGTSGEFYNTSEYAMFADKGRGSGRMPPDAAIRDWCKRKGIPESAVYPIRKKIAEKGTQQYQKQESHIGIDYQGNIKPGGLVEQANRKFEALIKNLRIV